MTSWPPGSSGAGGGGLVAKAGAVSQREIGAAAISVGGVSWGAWATASASMAADLVVTGYVIQFSDFASPGGDFRDVIELACGVGSTPEVRCTALTSEWGSSSGGPNFSQDVTLSAPFRVAAGQSLKVRARHVSKSQTRTALVNFVGVYVADLASG